MDKYEKHEIMGHNVDLRRVENPILRRALECFTNKGFMFMYNNHTDHKESDHTDYFSCPSSERGGHVDNYTKTHTDYDD